MRPTKSNQRRTHSHRRLRPLGAKLWPLAVLVVVPSLILAIGVSELRSQDRAPGLTRSVETEKVPAGGRATPLKYHPADDLAAWTAMEVLIPETRGAKGWLDKAAALAPWEERSPRLSVKGRRPGRKGLLVGYSQLEADREAAMTGAEQSAARQIVALVIWGVRDLLDEESLLDFETAVKVTMEQVRRAIRGARLEVFEQAIDRPYGRLHRAAVLVGADKKFLQKLTAKVRTALRKSEAKAKAERRVVFWKSGIAVALTLLVVIGYAILNALTKGYFTWTLRALSLVSVAAVYAALAFLKFG